jgi:hypothetical protein
MFKIWMNYSKQNTKILMSEFIIFISLFEGANDWYEIDSEM